MLSLGVVLLPLATDLPIVAMQSTPLERLEKLAPLPGFRNWEVRRPTQVRLGNQWVQPEY